MKLIKSKNPNIYYCFGNKDDSLFRLKAGEVAILVSEKEITKDRFVMADQTHSTEVRVIEEADFGSGFLAHKAAIPIVDGFVTDLSNVFIVIKGADCTPILVYSKSKNIVGGCHSGREGTKNGIVKEVISKMLEVYGASLDDLIVMVGPAISGENYQVSEEIYNDFINITGLEQSYRKIDMQKVIFRDVLEMGIKRENVQLDSVCTYADSRYFSYRRDKSKDRQLAIIGISDGKIF